MASREADAHVLAQERLRAVVAQAVGASWRSLSGYDERNVPEFLARAVPVVLAGQRQSVALTEAFVARLLRRPPRGVDRTALIGAAVRAGVPPEEVYRRPFVQLWAALAAGTQFQDAVSGALARAQASAEMDVQLASRATFGAVQEADDGIYGYQRVADAGACEFCQMIDGAYVKSAHAMPLHNRCGCSLEPLTEPHRRAAKLPSGVAVHKHGELGPVLGAPQHDFTGPSGLS